MNPSPLAIDLCCGFGGWAKGLIAAGFRVVGFDNDPKCAEHYPGEFVLADVAHLDGRRFRSARLIVASPPCQFYAKRVLPASWGKNWKPDDGGATWTHVERIIHEATPEFWAIENVRGAEGVRGKAKKRVGSRRVWGNFPPIDPEPIYGKWRTPPGPDRAHIRALVPFPLAFAIGRACA